MPMLTHQSPPTGAYGDDEPYYSLLLFDYHQEYASVLNQRIPYEGRVRVSADIVWDPYRTDELLSAWMPPADSNDPESVKARQALIELKVRKVGRRLLPTTWDDFTTACDQGYTWLIEGTLPGLYAAFQLLYDVLAYTNPKSDAAYDQGPSGDDDVYDYWPNTMDMLWAFAADIDGINGDNALRTKVRLMAAGIARKTFGEDPTYCEWGSDGGWLPTDWNTNEQEGG